MSKRNLLHKSKLGALKSWLDAEGIQHRAGKGGYQVLQVMTHKGWQVVFDKHTDEHFTVNEVLVPIVTRFIRSKKQVPDDVSELLKCLKDVIEDLELRAQVHKTLTGEEMVVPLSDGRYRKAKDVIAKFDGVG